MSESTTDQRSRCLIVDADSSATEVLASALRSEGFSVDTAIDGEAAVNMCKEDPPDVVLLDYELPGSNGQQVCIALRQFCDSYIMFVSERDAEVYRVMCLTAGADDYMTKPVSTAELTARIHAMLRRPRHLMTVPAKSVTSTMTINDLVVDERAWKASVRGKALGLTGVEFRTLLVLAKRSPDLVTRSQLNNEVWQSDSHLDRRIIDSHMHNLRRKLRAATAGVQIQTERGTGFRLVDSSN